MYSNNAFIQFYINTYIIEYKYSEIFFKERML